MASGLVSVDLPATADVVVIGAGIIGASCAYYTARTGLSVAVLDRASVAGGTTGAGEGNLLVSDKAPGPELDLMLRSLALWSKLGSTLDGHAIELEPKGGLVVAATAQALAQLSALAAGQRGFGVDVQEVGPDALLDHEPQLNPHLAGGAYYPQDMQVQPMLAAAHLLRAAVREHGASLHSAVEVTGIQRTTAGAILGVRTDRGRIATDTIVNSAGAWAGEVAAMADAPLPILPRRGCVLVTQPLPRMIRHKVYAADYMATVASGSADLQVSAVVEGTPAGPILIGASRERVGFDRRPAPAVMRRLATAAAELFPFLAGVHVLRAYLGFRPYTTDHLPAIGADPRVQGLHHACGHEGAGIGLAPATGELIAALITGAATAIDPTPFSPARLVADDQSRSLS